MGAPKQYAVLYEPSADGTVGAYVPDLPGCFSSGTDREDAERQIKEAIELYLDELRATGQSAPEPKTTTGYVDAA